MNGKRKETVVSLLRGGALGGVLECLAALVGSSRGGAEGALYWAQSAGILMGVIGVWLLVRRLVKAEGPQIYRPGRTWLELEYEGQAAYKENEKALRESGGESHRMPRPRRSGATLWTDVGVLLSSLLPMLVSLFLRDCLVS